MYKTGKFLKGNAIIVALSVLSPFILTPLVGAAEEDGVTATVTVTNISITVSDGGIEYGALSTSSTLDTTSATDQLNDSQTVTNGSNVPIDLKVKGVDTASWTLGANAGAETYTHKTCVATCDTTPSWTAMTTSYGTAILTNVAVSATPAVDFQIGTPSSTVATAQQQVDVTIMGVEY